MATISTNLQHAIGSLFEVHTDEGNVQRVVTPLEYPGSNDQIVVRVRPGQNGVGYSIDENGEAAFYASLNGGDVDSEAFGRWATELPQFSPVRFDEQEVLSAFTQNEKLIAPYIFRVAEAAQQLLSIATSRAPRQESLFKHLVKQTVQEIAAQLNLEYKADVELPISGGLIADHVVGTNHPLIIFSATSATRLLEAEVVYMQYRQEKKPGYILAVAESQESVGKKQYERAGYYTNKVLIFNQGAFGNYLSNDLKSLIH